MKPLVSTPCCNYCDSSFNAGIWPCHPFSLAQVWLSKRTHPQKTQTYSPYRYRLNLISSPILSLSLSLFLIFHYISLSKFNPVFPLSVLTGSSNNFIFFFFNYTLIARPWKYFFNLEEELLVKAGTIHLSFRPVIRVIDVLHISSRKMKHPRKKKAIMVIDLHNAHC